MHPFAVPGQESSLARPESPAAAAANLDELIHDLRQPLSAIESLAYYLELTATEDRVCAHMQKIRDMLGKANAILERTAINAGRSVA